MPVQVTQVGDEPIIIAQPSGEYNPKTDPARVRALTNTLVARIDAPTVYRITDLSTLTMTFFDLIMGLRDDGANADRRECFLFVGSDQMVQMAATAQSQNGDQRALVFPTLEDALQYARSQIQGHSRSA